MDQLQDIRKYYEEKLNTHGTTPRGVDWNSEESQNIRFEQLTGIITDAKNDLFTVLDYGCGFGSYYAYIKHLYPRAAYYGFDISPEMVNKARSLCPEDAIWTSSEEEMASRRYDYIVASGIFNVKLQTPDHIWYNYIEQTLQKLNNLSTRGFSFNLLTKYSDKEYMKNYLYYADPLQLFDHCKVNFAKNIALLHDYDLYEFTLFVRK